MIDSVRKESNLFYVVSQNIILTLNPNRSITVVLLRVTYTPSFLLTCYQSTISPTLCLNPSYRPPLSFPPSPSTQLFHSCRLLPNYFSLKTKQKQHKTLVKPPLRREASRDLLPSTVKPPLPPAISSLLTTNHRCPSPPASAIFVIHRFLQSPSVIHHRPQP